MQALAFCFLIIAYKFVYQECHSDPSGGHLGREKTLYKIKCRFYWPQLYVEVDNLVSHCMG